MSTSAQIHVAVVDDDASQCRSLGRLLRACGLCPAMYPSAEALLDDVERTRFGCLLVDIQLGGMSGIELHRHLRSRGLSTPVIFITVHDEPEIRRQAFDTGCAAFFRKTDAGAIIIEAIHRAIAGTPSYYGLPQI